MRPEFTKSILLLLTNHITTAQLFIVLSVGALNICQIHLQQSFIFMLQDKYLVKFIPFISLSFCKIIIYINFQYKHYINNDVIVSNKIVLHGWPSSCQITWHIICIIMGKERASLLLFLFMPQNKWQLWFDKNTDSCVGACHLAQ